MSDEPIPYGVHSEVGTLRKVLVCAPGLAHRRLTPTNCDDLLFDDVMWGQNAQRDHFDFMTEMREQDVEVVELHNLPAETMDLPDAKAWLLDGKIVANEVGLGLVDEARAYLDDETLSSYLPIVGRLPLPERAESDGPTAQTRTSRRSETTSAARSTS